MKKTPLVSLIALVGIISLIFMGCSKKKEELPMAEMQTQTATGQLNAESLTAQALNKAEVVSQAAMSAKQAEQIAGPAMEAGVQVTKPTPEQIQTALKNAGYYTGAIDGKLGPRSKKAIEGFQKDNGLTVDGKVGAKTWNKLQAHLTASAGQQTGD
jgi:peptidoglycan hydrolase-like protein with peptidoglycan-binding domain